MIRRLFPLVFLALGCARHSGPAPRADAGFASMAVPAPEDREQTADQQVRHALARLTFGPRPGDPERVRAMGVDRWIAMQLNPASIPDDSVQRYLAPLRTLAMSSRDLVEAYPPPQQLRQEMRRDSMPSAADSIAYRDAVRASQ